ncbi:MAG: sensor histidine kinase [Planctomycetota bacterium]|nr:MAG: sensor histidine kinase [Planctomycetota bacterium]
MPSARADRHWIVSLRTRLMLWNALAVLATAVATMLGLRAGVRIALVRELDQVLREDLREVELALHGRGNLDHSRVAEQLQRKAEGHADHQWFAQMFSTDGELLLTTSDQLPQELARPLPQERGELSGWRYFQRRLDTHPAVVLRVGMSTASIQRDLQRIDRLVALGVGLVLLIAPIGGFWLAGRAIRPLDAMINTVTHLRPANLEDRLKVRGTGDELDRLSVAFNSLLDRIGTYLQEHRELLANAAHELRTPLAAIRSSIEVALANQRSPQEYCELLQEVIGESAHLEALVHQLLLLSESDAERMRIHKDPVRLDAMIERAIDMFGSYAEAEGIELRCAALPQVTVRGNAQHLKQVLYNLLDNAFKYTPSGGVVSIELKLENSGWVQLNVMDTGVGIAPEELPFVFDRFYRGSRPPRSSYTVHRHNRSTGLGLSICRAIVRAHGGTITAAAGGRGGTVFCVRLPLDAGGLAPEAPAQQTSSNAAQRSGSAPHQSETPAARQASTEATRGGTAMELRSGAAPC